MRWKTSDKNVRKYAPATTTTVYVSILELPGVFNCYLATTIIHFKFAIQVEYMRIK